MWVLASVRSRWETSGVCFPNLFKKNLKKLMRHDLLLRFSIWRHPCFSGPQQLKEPCKMQEGTCWNCHLFSKFTFVNNLSALGNILWNTSCLKGYIYKLASSLINIALQTFFLFLFFSGWTVKRSWNTQEATCHLKLTSHLFSPLTNQIESQQPSIIH